MELFEDFFIVLLYNLNVQIIKFEILRETFYQFVQV